MKDSIFDIIKKLTYLQNSIVDNEYDFHTMNQLRTEFQNLCQKFYNHNKDEFNNLCNNSEFRNMIYNNDLHFIVDKVIYDKCGDYCSISFPENTGYLEDVYINNTGICKTDDIDAKLYRKGTNYIVVWRGNFTVEIDTI
jgi:hypothetical protein